MITELIARSFVVRDLTHVAHWKSTSYAEHETLGKLYVGIVDCLDAIVETYVGTYGLFGDLPDYEPDQTEISALVQEEADWLDANRDSICEGSQAVGSLVDGLTTLYAKTAYLLSMK